MARIEAIIETKRIFPLPKKIQPPIDISADTQSNHTFKRLGQFNFVPEANCVRVEKQSVENGVSIISNGHVVTGADAFTLNENFSPLIVRGRRRELSLYFRK